MTGGQDLFTVYLDCGHVARRDRQMKPGELAVCGRCMDKVAVVESPSRPRAGVDHWLDDDDAIDYESDIPQHVQLAAILRAKIVAYGMAKDTHAPSETQLAVKYGVGRDVVRRAYRLLDHLGYTRVVKGVGHFTTREQVTEVIRPQTDSFVVARPATPRERAELGLVPGDMLLVVKEPGERPVIYDATRSIVEFTSPS